MGNYDMRLFHIKNGLFSVIRLLVVLSLWIRSCGDGNCSRRATIRLGIDTLIANILVAVCYRITHRVIATVDSSPAIAQLHAFRI